ncbi:hypothetical protein A7U60_g1600 [Sanghuangporus baumii]|uniref:protein-tyrosine-phosphatase n=1 Tax=Sanghuangporus baumii TaxID=108892 RepID=A0A9Q5I447_SANBA|nr:hypothetical protein A7U60_g1600 [Sanghuangporus baumii]
MGRKVAVKASKMNSTADLNDDTDPSHNINTNTNTNTNTSSNTGTNTNTSTNTNTNNNTDANTNTNTSTNTSTSTSTNTHTSTSTDTSTDTSADTNADADSGAVEILPYLFLGPRSAAASEPFIRARGITHVLSIGASPPRPALPGVVYTRVPMLDSPSVRIENVYQRAREAIEAVRPPEEVPNRVDSRSSPSSPVPVQAKAKQTLKQNQKQKGKEKKILVHCSTAVSRSPSIVAAYLMSEHNMSLRESLGRIVRARPAVNPNPGLFAQLKEMEVRIRGCSSLEGVDSLPGRKEERVRLFEECERAHDDDDEEEEEEEWGLKKIEEDGEIDSFFPVIRTNDLCRSSRISSNLLRRLNPRSQTDNVEVDVTILDFVIDTVIRQSKVQEVLDSIPYH